jgi:hypothetical protein
MGHHLPPGVQDVDVGQVGVAVLKVTELLLHGQPIGKQKIVQDQKGQVPGQAPGFLPEGPFPFGQQKEPTSKKEHPPRGQGGQQNGEEELLHEPPPHGNTSRARR